MAYQQCNRCIMDNYSDKTIKFDKNGNCNYCSSALLRLPQEYFPNSEGKKKLALIFQEIKERCKNDKFDCLVGLSGGIDSSYILYLGRKFGLRMLAVHVDDGLDNPTATANIDKIVNKSHAEFHVIRPDKEEYADLLKTLFKASIPNLAIVQDNLIIHSLQKFSEDNNIKYILDGLNFPHECILEHGNGVNACDRGFILKLQKKFGEVELSQLDFSSLLDRYIRRNYFSKVIHIRPLNYIEYNLEDAITELHDYCGFEYYGGKHYESILTRFLQCYYLPEKFGIDKRKSHFSSLIVTDQLTREMALERMKEPLYKSNEVLLSDKQLLATYMGISIEELDAYIALTPKSERDYAHSILNELAPIARKLRKFLDK